MMGGTCLPFPEVFPGNACKSGWILYKNTAIECPMSFAVLPSPTEQLSLLQACAEEFEAAAEPVAESAPEPTGWAEPPPKPKTPQRLLERPPASIDLPEAQTPPPPPTAVPPPRPELLHPAVWLGHQLGRHAQTTSPSGFAELDDQLPGGGWPHRVLT